MYNDKISTHWSWSILNIMVLTMAARFLSMFLNGLRELLTLIHWLSSADNSGLSRHSLMSPNLYETHEKMGWYFTYLNSRFRETNFLSQSLSRKDVWVVSAFELWRQKKKTNSLQKNIIISVITIIILKFKFHSVRIKFYCSRHSRKDIPGTL